MKHAIHRRDPEIKSKIQSYALCHFTSLFKTGESDVTNHLQKSDISERKFNIALVTQDAKTCVIFTTDKQITTVFMLTVFCHPPHPLQTR
jgi:hypothetical protein